MGNYESYQVPSKGEHHDRPEPMSGNHGKAVLTVGPDGQMVVTDNVTLRTSTYHQPNGLEGVLASARTPSGSPTSDIQDSTIVTVNGQQLRADLAARLGWIKRDSSGRYV